MIFTCAKRCCALLLLAATLYQCSSNRNTIATPEQDLQALLRYMTGDFSSAAQSKRDTDFYDIRLHIRPIWAADKANHWLYVEQATASAEAKPYRQRVYKVENDGAGGFKSIVYTLPDQANWAGKYKTPEAFNSLTVKELTLRDGCTVFLKKQPNRTFSGATQGMGCESTLRGAKYASSKVTITPKMLLSWDQGFNEKGEQMWGATKSGYEFIKN